MKQLTLIDFELERIKEDESARWQDQALEFLRRFPERRFQAEDVREWAYKNGLSFPTNCRAWGSVMIEAKKSGIILFDGYERVSNPKAHRTPASVWVRP